jgi:hypothetical protein
MDADIGRHPAAPGRIAFPRGGIPSAARGDIGEVYVVYPILRRLRHPLLQAEYFGMIPQLQNGAHPTTGTLLQACHLLQLRGFEPQGLLADHIHPPFQTVGDMGKVEMVGGAHAEPIRRTSAHRGIEPVEIGRKTGFRKIPVENAHAVERIVGHGQPVPQRPNGLQMPRSHIARHAHHRKSLLLHEIHRLFCYHAVRLLFRQRKDREEEFPREPHVNLSPHCNFQNILL